MDSRAQFQRDGYLHIKGFFTAQVLEPFYSEITRLGRKIVGADFDFRGGSDCYTPEKQSLFYDALRYLPALHEVSSNRRLLQLCEELGLEFPCVMGSCNMRMDRPGDTQKLFKWHQDTLYLLGSPNAVTIWIPLGPVNKHYGSIGVIPASHRNGIYPFKKISDKEVTPNVPLLQRDLALNYVVDENREVVVEADVGDVVIFYQMLLHRSLPNLSNEIRWTCQVRIADLFEDAFMKSRYPMGERTNIYYVKYDGGNIDN